MRTLFLLSRYVWILYGILSCSVLSSMESVPPEISSGQVQKIAKISSWHSEVFFKGSETQDLSTILNLYQQLLPIMVQDAGFRQEEWQELFLRSCLCHEVHSTLTGVIACSLFHALQQSEYLVQHKLMSGVKLLYHPDLSRLSVDERTKVRRKIYDTVWRTLCQLDPVQYDTHIKQVHTYLEPELREIAQYVQYRAHRYMPPRPSYWAVSPSFYINCIMLMEWIKTQSVQDTYDHKTFVVNPYLGIKRIDVQEVKSFVPIPGGKLLESACVFAASLFKNSDLGARMVAQLGNTTAEQFDSYCACLDAYFYDIVTKDPLVRVLHEEVAKKLHFCADTFSAHEKQCVDNLQLGGLIAYSIYKQYDAAVAKVLQDTALPKTGQLISYYLSLDAFFKKIHERPSLPKTDKEFLEQVDHARKFLYVSHGEFCQVKPYVYELQARAQDIEKRRTIYPSSTEIAAFIAGNSVESVAMELEKLEL